MIGLWTLLLSVVVLAVTIAAAVLCFRSGHRVAVVLGLDAAIIAGLGILLNSTTSGELLGSDVLIFTALPVVLAVVGSVLALRGQNSDERYQSA